MHKILFNILSISILIGGVSAADANGWFGKNNSWGGNSFFGNNNGCNDWPEWTPMYWMEEMAGNNDNCYSGAYGGRYGSPYQSLYSPYSPYAGGVNPYMANPYLGASPYGYPRLPAYGAGLPRGGTGFPALGNSSFSSFPSFGGNSFSSPFSSFSGSKSPFSSFGGGSPWSSFGSPMSSPMGLGGFGSPFSPMSPMSMGTMGMPGMSPMSSMGGMGSPFGGSGFSPFR